MISASGERLSLLALIAEIFFELHYAFPNIYPKGEIFNKKQKNPKKLLTNKKKCGIIPLLSRNDNIKPFGEVSKWS